MPAAARAARTAGVRSFVSARSMPQRIGAVGVLAALVLAPFGGLSRADTDAAAPMRLAHRYDIGPFYVTVDRVETLGRLGVAVPPQGDRLLVIEITVTNHSDRAEYQSLAISAIGGDHTGAVPWSGAHTIAPRVYDVADGSEQEGGDWVNPGQSYQLAITVPQRGGTPPGFTLSLNGYVFQADDPSTLDPNAWVQRLHVADGPVPVEDKP